MKYSLKIRKHNEKAHLDIETDVQYKKDGLFTFVLRVNNGNIVDYNIMEYVNGDKYTGLEQALIEELAAAYNHQSGNTDNTVRANNGQRRTERRSGTTKDA